MENKDEVTFPVAVPAAIAAKVAAGEELTAEEKDVILAAGAEVVRKALE